jgi:hypothetical protein
MQIAIGTGPDVSQTIARCRELDVTNVFLNGPSFPGVQKTGVPEASAVSESVARLRSEGLAVSSASWWLGRYPARPWRQGSSDPSFLLDESSSVLAAELEALRVFGDAGIRNLLHYVDIALPDRPQDEGAVWNGLLRAYEQIIPVAETNGLCIGNHSLHRLLPNGVRQKALAEGITLADYGSYRAEGWGGPFLLDTWEALSVLVTEVDSPHNGITLCTGMEFLGADLDAIARRFADRIHFCQIRDHTGSWPEGVECPFGRGHLDIPSVVSLLRNVGYAGPVHPEHLGKPGPGEDPLADAVRLLRSMPSQS